MARASAGRQWESRHGQGNHSVDLNAPSDPPPVGIKGPGQGSEDPHCHGIEIAAKAAAMIAATRLRAKQSIAPWRLGSRKASLLTDYSYARNGCILI
jgi:hypothetical protein